MNYLHACYHPDSPNKLFIFGENPDYSSPKRRGRKPRNVVIHHPTCLSFETLEKILIDLNSDFILNTETLTLAMPVHDNHPVSSFDPISDEPVSFSPISIYAVSIEMLSLVRLFPALTILPPDTRCSDSLIFFRYAFEFAMELVSRELFIPTLEENQGGVGSWAAIIQGEDRLRLADLAAGMPFVCGSFTEGRTD